MCPRLNLGEAASARPPTLLTLLLLSIHLPLAHTSPIHFYLAQISIRNTEITFSIWDLGGQREFVNMLPLVCNDAVAILFMFDLSRKSTLNSIKEWYRQARGFNKVSHSEAREGEGRERPQGRSREVAGMETRVVGAIRLRRVFAAVGFRARNSRLISNLPSAQTAIPFLVGTKYDHFNTFSQDEQEEITRQVCLLLFSAARSTTS